MKRCFPSSTSELLWNVYRIYYLLLLFKMDTNKASGARLFVTHTLAIEISMHFHSRQQKKPSLSKTAHTKDLIICRTMCRVVVQSSSKSQTIVISYSETRYVDEFPNLHFFFCCFFFCWDQQKNFSSPDLTRLNKAQLRYLNVPLWCVLLLIFLFVWQSWLCCVCVRESAQAQPDRIKWQLCAHHKQFVTLFYTNFDIDFIEISWIIFCFFF